MKIVGSVKVMYKLETGNKDSIYLFEDRMVRANFEEQRTPSSWFAFHSFSWMNIQFLKKVFVC